MAIVETMAAGTTPATDSIEGRSLAERLRNAAGLWARSQYELVTLAADFTDTGECALDGCRNAAEWLSIVADCDTATAREWLSH